jgi:ureidoglycolate lyase
MHLLPIRPLIQSAFAPFGRVVEVEGALPVPINQGFATRFNELADVDVSADGGHPQICLFTADPRPAPIALRLMERHPLGSQLFYPLQDRPWLIVVCSDAADMSSYRAFEASGRQGVTYARNVWHHPLIVLDPHSRFIVVDRAGPGNNLEEHWLEDHSSDPAYGLHLSPTKT